MTEQNFENLERRPSNIVDLFVSGGKDESRQDSRAVLVLDFFGVDDTKENIADLIEAAINAPPDALAIDIVPEICERFNVRGEVIVSILERDLVQMTDGKILRFTPRADKIRARRLAAIGE